MAGLNQLPANGRGLIRGNYQALPENDPIMNLKTYMPTAVFGGFANARTQVTRPSPLGFKPTAWPDQTSSPDYGCQPTIAVRTVGKCPRDGIRKWAQAHSTPRGLPFDNQGRSTFCRHRKVPPE